SHVSADFVPDENVVRRAVAAYQKANAPAWPRSRAEVLRFFDGFDLVEPGLVPKAQWRPAPGTDAADVPDVSWCGVARLRASALPLAALCRAGGDPVPERAPALVLEDPAVGLDDPPGAGVTGVAGDQRRVNAHGAGVRQHRPQRSEERRVGKECRSRW